MDEARLAIAPDSELFIPPDSLLRITAFQSQQSIDIDPQFVKDMPPKFAEAFGKARHATTVSNIFKMNERFEV